MKRRSDLNILHLGKNFPHNDLQLQLAQRLVRKNYSTLKYIDEMLIENGNFTFIVNQFRSSSVVVNALLDDIINGLQQDIQVVQRKKMIASATSLTNSMGNKLYLLQDPEKDSNQICMRPEEQPLKNNTDPISGFVKQNFIKKQNKKHKMSNDDSYILLREVPEVASEFCNQSQKKLPPLMKQLSQQKLNNKDFIPLEGNPNFMRRRSSVDLGQAVRQRLLKQVQNRKFKQNIEAIAAIGQNLKKNNKRNSRSTHESAHKFNSKEDCNFDYDGNKITLYNSGKVKSHVKVIKALCKLQKQKPEDKPVKLQKKFHQRISYKPRFSKNYMQVNNKTIGDFSDINYSAALKEKLEMELRKTDVKFAQKEYYGKQRERKAPFLA